MSKIRCSCAVRICGATVLVAGVAVAICGKVRAGGVTFSTPADIAANSGPPFAGFVKDRDGNPVPQAKVTVSVKSFNWTLILRTDSNGHFFVSGFDKSVDPSTVEIDCSKSGYKEYAKSRRPRSSDPKAAIETTCILQKL